MKWEYKKVDIQHWVDEIAALNLAGAEGWELVHLKRQNTGPGLTSVYFKRQVAAEESKGLADPPGCNYDDPDAPPITTSQLRLVLEELKALAKELQSLSVVERPGSSFNAPLGNSW
jgi:hypothetical protein